MQRCTAVILCTYDASGNDTFWQWIIQRMGGQFSHISFANYSPDITSEAYQFRLMMLQFPLSNKEIPFVPSEGSFILLSSHSFTDLRQVCCSEYFHNVSKSSAVFYFCKFNLFSRWVLNLLTSSSASLFLAIQHFHLKVKLAFVALL